MKHRTTFKKQHEELLFEEDEDVQELLWQRWKEEQLYIARKEAAERAERRARYFFGDGTCKNHDRYGCRECSNVQ